MKSIYSTGVHVNVESISLDNIAVFVFIHFLCLCVYLNKNILIVQLLKNPRTNTIYRIYTTGVSFVRKHGYLFLKILNTWHNGL